MMYPIRFAEITEETEFYEEVVGLQQEAVNYLSQFKWCEQILDSYLYLNLGSVLCVFVFHIENNASEDDSLLWVVVGDLPPMYLDIHGAKTVKEVLEDYVYLAKEWVSKVKANESIEDCYPFDAKPTVEMADLFYKKVSFMRDTLIDNIDDIELRT